MTPLTAWPEPVGLAAPPAAVARSDQDVIELQLLLPLWQAEAVEAAARRRGMTTGQMLRRVIADLFPPADDR
ncbi:MAG: hypothetical protein U0871_09695 [Gemmataceae bacterium]